MHAIIESGGKQYKVAEGDVITVEKLNDEVGSTIDLDKVLMIIDNSKTKIGKPYIKDAKATARVMEHGKGKKILVFHYKAKKNIRKRYGHRQPFTKLLIETIAAKSEE